MNSSEDKTNLLNINENENDNDENMSTQIISKKAKTSLFFKSYKNIIIIALISISILLLFICIYYIGKNENNNKSDSSLIIKSNSNDSLTKDIQKFYEILPSFIKCDSNGNLNLDRSGFKPIPNDRKQYSPRQKIKIDKLETNQMQKIKGDLDVSASLDISIIHSDFNFKAEVKEMIDYAYDCHLYSFVAKKEIGCIDYKAEDIILEDSFKNKIEKLSTELSLSDADKAKSLDELFQSHGYYIPLKIYFGGLFTVEMKDIQKYMNKTSLQKYKSNFENSHLTLNIDANFSKNDNDFLEELYSISNKFVLGGDTKKKKFNGWLKSIDNSNAEIISYDNIIKVTYLLDDDIKSKLSGPLKLIDEKYQNRANYYETIKKVKGIKNDYGEIKRNGNDYFELGLKDDYSNLIYYKAYVVNEDWEIGRITKTINISSNDIIVGCQIVPKKEKNGSWILENNPLLTHSMTIKFTSQQWRGIQYMIYVYIMKFPE